MKNVSKYFVLTVTLTKFLFTNNQEHASQQIMSSTRKRLGDKSEEFFSFVC